MSQSNRRSRLEAWTNTVVGYFIALLTQFVAFPIVNIDVPLRTNMILGAIFMFVSYWRAYFIRRLFNKTD